MRRCYIDIPEGQVHYQTDGSGENLLLLHGTGLSSEEYFQMIPILAKRCRVVAMDLLGYGNSDKPPLEFQIEDYARSILHFLDALGIKKTSIVGDHVGSRLAVEVAATWPERVDKLVLCGCPWYTLEERRVLPGDPRFRSLEIKDDGLFLMQLWQTFRSMRRSEIKPEVLCKLMAVSLMAGARFHDLHQAAFQHDIEPRLRLIKSPTLLVSGSEDMFYDRLETISKLIPQCKTRVITGTGSLICLEKPNKFAEVILDFLETL
jgi:pimeloyl-ACP methyl ester carboxylesterase